MAKYDPRSLKSAEWLWSRMFPFVEKNATIAEIMEVGFLPKGWDVPVGTILMLDAADGMALVHVAEFTDTNFPVLAFVNTTEAPAVTTTRKRAA